MTDAPTPPENIPLPPSNGSLNSSPQNTVPIQDRTSSSLESYNEDKSLNFHMAPSDQKNNPNPPPGSQDNPIDVNEIPLSPTSNALPNDPSVDGFLHYLQHEVYIICGKCKKTGHTRPQCIWNREVVCDRCKQQGHSERSCNAEMYIDQGRFGRQSPPWLIIQ